MSEPISGAAGQFFRQILEKQSLQQQTPETQGKRSFDSYLQQQDKSGQTTGERQPTETQSIDQTDNIKTSGVEMQRKLDQMEAELASRFKQNGQESGNVLKMMPELLDGKTRLGLLKEAYSSVNSTKATSDLGGQLTKLEGEYKQVESIMHSDKNLSTGELLALQARLYQVSQHIEVMSKVVDQMAGGIKTVLNTNI